jgi:hypothetical protein
MGMILSFSSYTDTDKILIRERRKSQQRFVRRNGSKNKQQSEKKTKDTNIIIPEIISPSLCGDTTASQGPKSTIH